MGFFDTFTNILQSIYALVKRYNSENVVVDSNIFIDSILCALLFPNSKIIYSEYNNIIDQATTISKNGNEDEALKLYSHAQNYIVNTVKRFHYEEELQYSQIQYVVSIALGNWSQIIEIIRNIDGQRSQQYFSRFTLPEHVNEILTQNICQIISREYSPYLRGYLTDLENYQKYAEFMNNNPTNGVGDTLIKSAIGGAIGLLNPLLGIGILAKQAYDNYKDIENDHTNRENLLSFNLKWSESFYNLHKIQFNICDKISSFVIDNISKSFDELIIAINKYCNDFNFNIDNIYNAIYQYRINYGRIPSFNDESEKEIFIKISTELVKYTHLHPGVLNYYKHVLQILS